MIQFSSVHLCSHVRLFATPWTRAPKAPLSMGFPRQEYWNGLPETKLPTSAISSKKEEGREFQKNIYFCLIDYAKAFDCMDHNKLWKILKEMGIPDNLTCLLRNLYAVQEATVQTGHGTTDGF